MLQMFWMRCGALAGLAAIIAAPLVVGVGKAPPLMHSDVASEGLALIQTRVVLSLGVVGGGKGKGQVPALTPHASAKLVKQCLTRASQVRAWCELRAGNQVTTMAQRFEDVLLNLKFSLEELPVGMPTHTGGNMTIGSWSQTPDRCGEAGLALLATSINATVSQMEAEISLYEHSRSFFSVLNFSPGAETVSFLVKLLNSETTYVTQENSACASAGYSQISHDMSKTEIRSKIRLTEKLRELQVVILIIVTMIIVSIVGFSGIYMTGILKPDLFQFSLSLILLALLLLAMVIAKLHPAQHFD